MAIKKEMGNVMHRPVSIIRFEQLYLGHIAIGFAASAIALFGTANPALTQATEAVGAWALPATLAVGLLVQATLWFFIARKGSSVAKWILAALTGLNLIGALFLLYGLATGFGAESRSMLGSLLSLGASALLVAAVSMLFRPDTRGWFGEAGAVA